MHKLLGLENPADLATKHLIRDKIEKCCDLLVYGFVDGRSATTADLHLREALQPRQCSVAHPVKSKSKYTEVTLLD